jgi:hypothetical protein
MRRYLLGQLTGPDEEKFELRLLGDSDFQQEFDIAVDEIATLYVNGQFTGEEKRQVEEHFLKAPERENKVKFIREMFQQAALPQGKQTEPDKTTETVTNSKPAVVVERETVAPPKPNLFERLRTWWGNQPASLRAASTFATVLVVVGLAFLLRPGEPTYQTVELAMTNSDRSAGTQIARVKLNSGTDALRVKLNLPADAPLAKTYQVKLRGEKVSRQLSIVQQHSQSLTVEIPADEVSIGSYAIELTAVMDNGTDVPLRGAYLFAVD